MIQLIDKGPNKSTISFSPRYEFKGKYKEVTKDLIYGHFCSWCGNVIQAMFYTDKQIDLIPYEETRVISQGYTNEGNLLKTVPNTVDINSNYKVDFYKTKNGNAQLIRLKNHLIKWEGLSGWWVNGVDRDKFFETGERCCKYIGVYALKDDWIIRDAALACGWRAAYERTVKESTIPIDYLKEYSKAYIKNDYVVVPVIGTGRSILLFNRDAVRYRNEAGFSALISTWKKDKDKIKLNYVPLSDSSEEAYLDEF